MRLKSNTISECLEVTLKIYDFVSGTKPHSASMI